MISFVNQFCEQDRPEPPAAPTALTGEPTAPTALPATIDLQALALTRFGDWRPKAAALVAKYKGVIFDVATTKGMADATAARIEVRAPRYAAQNVSKASKSELARVSKAIGAEEQAVIDALAETEEHINAQIVAGEARRAAEKAERDRIEAERVAKHRAGIETIKGYVAKAQGRTAAEIDAGYDVLTNLRFDPVAFEEFAEEAAHAMRATLDALVELSNAAAARELDARRMEAQRIEQARVAAELAALRKKIDDENAALARRTAEFQAEQAATREREERLADQRRREAELAAQNTPQEGANRDASAGQSHGADGSDSPTGRGTDGAPAVGAAPPSSPVGGPMGAGQPAAAGPTVDVYLPPTEVAAPMPGPEAAPPFVPLYFQGQLSEIGELDVKAIASNLGAPGFLLTLPGGRTIAVMGLTRAECRCLSPAFMDGLTLTVER